jgi:indole-3-pyruvate monooxygenase
MTEQVAIVGAGPSGLAVAACLKRRGVPAVVLESETQVAPVWRKHYDRLHLHTAKGGSSLPGLDFPSDYPRFPSREQFIAYLEGYARHFDIRPSFEEPVTRIAPNGAGWVVTTQKRTLPVQHVVVATGYTRLPLEPTWPGQERFRGPVMHSSRYRNGAPFKRQRVLIVGLGNSGGEIAIDLHEHGAQPTIAVRSPVSVIPRELLGLPILSVAALFRSFPPRVADLLAAPLLALAIGDITKLGLRRRPYGPLEQVKRDGRVPLIDVGTLALAREGKVKIAPGVERFTETSAVFEGGATEPFDAVVLATGFRPALEQFLPSAAELCNAKGFPRADGQVKPGLHLCGFQLSTRGMLKEIGVEAERTASEISAALRN